jgi:hypothetical protein
MSLTGQGILWVLGALTVGLPVVTIVLWSRLSRRHVLTVASRAGLIVASQLVTVALVAVAVNDYAYLYGSWTEVWRSFAQPFDAHYRVSPLTQGHVAGRVTVGGVSQIQPVGPYGRSSRWSKVGRLETARINGGSSQLSEDAYVYLPPEYFQARYRHTRFPAVEILSGYPSTKAMLVQRLAFQVQLLHQIRQHRAQPMVLVMLRPIVTYPRDTECTNVPAGPQAETFYSQDLTSAMARDYRVTPTGWGIMGISTGGYCATKILMDYPALFSAGVSLSGYYHALQDYTTGNLWGGSVVLKNRNSPIWRLRHEPAPAVSLLVTSSKDEVPSVLGYSDTVKFLALVRPPMQVSTIITEHGSHTFTTWKPQVPGTFRWLSARLHAQGPTAFVVPNGRVGPLGVAAPLHARAGGR